MEGVQVLLRFPRPEASLGSAQDHDGRDERVSSAKLDAIMSFNRKSSHYRY